MADSQGFAEGPMSHSLHLDPRDEMALCLDQRECQAFGVNDGTYPKHMLTANGVAPTALHAWVSQLRACPCGCRDFGLSAQRLHEKGLFGLLVSSCSECLASQPIRHVHPSEALALNGMDPTLDFGLDVRLTLSGIGQIASPLQAAWIFAIIMSRVEVLSKDSVIFSPLSQLVAFRSWLVMKCQEVWPCTTRMIEDHQLNELVAFWKPIKGLSLEQVVHPPQWGDRSDAHLSIAAVLDLLIRQTQMTQHPAAVPDDTETPWYESPVVEPQCDASFSVGVTEVTLVDAQGSCLSFRFQASSTVADVLAAHAKLTGAMHVAYICDHFGQGLEIDQPLKASQQVQIFFASDGQGMSFDADGLPHTGEGFEARQPDAFVGGDTVTEGSLGDVRDNVPCVQLSDMQAQGQSLPVVSPTLPWVAEDVHRHDLDSTQATIAHPAGTGQISALLMLSENQFLRLGVPRLDDHNKFRALRQQFVVSRERLSLLQMQGSFWADDEIAFHLGLLTSPASSVSPSYHEVLRVMRFPQRPGPVIT